MSNRESVTTARDIQRAIWAVESLMAGAHSPARVRQLRARHARLTAELNR